MSHYFVISNSHTTERMNNAGCGQLKNERYVDYVLCQRLCKGNFYSPVAKAISRIVNIIKI